MDEGILNRLCMLCLDQTTTKRILLVRRRSTVSTVASVGGTDEPVGSAGALCHGGIAARVMALPQLGTKGRISHN